MGRTFLKVRLSVELGHETVGAGSADVPSAFGPRRVISDIEHYRRFSRFALSADGTSAFPAVADDFEGSRY